MPVWMQVQVDARAGCWGSQRGMARARAALTSIPAAYWPPNMAARARLKNQFCVLFARGNFVRGAPSKVGKLIYQLEISSEIPGN